jgi:hypothetical protein
MDQREDRVSGKREDPGKRADQLEQKAGAIRSDLDELVGELDQRTHDALRRYVKPIAIGAAVLVVGIVSLLVWRKARRRPSNLERLGLAMRRAIAHPERVAKPAPSIGTKIIAAAGAAGASMAVRKLVARGLPDRKAQPGR